MNINLQKKKNKKRRQCGFTLIEIIVVLVILGILAAVAIPALTGYIDRAREAEAITECREVVLAAGVKALQLFGEDRLDELGPGIYGEVQDLSGMNGNISGIEWDGVDVTSVSYDATNGINIIYDKNFLANGRAAEYTRGGGNDYPKTGSRITLTTTTGEEVPVVISGDWEAVLDTIHEKGSLLGTGIVYADETGAYIYIAGDNQYVGQTNKDLTLEDIRQANPTALYKVDLSQKVYTDADITRDQYGTYWTEGKLPRGTLCTLNGKLYIARDNLKSEHDVPPGNWIEVVQ